MGKVSLRLSNLPEVFSGLRLEPDLSAVSLLLDLQGLGQGHSEHPGEGLAGISSNKSQVHGVLVSSEVALILSLKDLADLGCCFP